MTKLLQFTPFVLLLLSTVTVGAQELNSHSNHDHSSCKHEQVPNASNKKVAHYFGMRDFSYKLKLSKDFVSPDTSNEHSVALIDVITSDEEANFNCSAGFCMNSRHFHKKGLTLNRQLFDYFLSISG